MNFSWNKIEEYGQPASGFLEMYKSDTGNRGKILAIINSFPQLPFSNYEKHVTITIFFDGIKALITDGFFHWVLDDLSDIIKGNEPHFFQEKTDKKLEHSQVQFYFVSKLPDLEYFTHGDYALE